MLINQINNVFRPNKIPQVVACWIAGLNLTRAGNSVTSWKCIKNEFITTQFNTTLRPDYDASDNSVDFTRNQHLFDGNNNMNLTDGYTLYCVHKIKNYTLRQGLFSLRQSIINDSSLEFYFQDSSGNLTLTGNRTGSSVSGFIKTTVQNLNEYGAYQIIVGNDEPSSSQNVLAFEMAELTNAGSVSGNNVIPDNPSKPYIGLGFGGAGSPGPAYLDGNIKSIVILNSALTGLNDPINERIYAWQKTQL